MKPQDELQRDELKQEFEQCIRECEQDLFAYVMGLTLNYTDTLDIMQEAAVRLWKNFGMYDRSRPFLIWARKFAHTEIMKARERGKYRDWMNRIFEEDVIDLMEWEHELHKGVLEVRKEALRDCLAKLHEPDVDLLKKRYWADAKLRELANEQQVPMHSLYRRLSKIRNMLQQCINRYTSEHQQATEHTFVMPIWPIKKPSIDDA